MDQKRKVLSLIDIDVSMIEICPEKDNIHDFLDIDEDIYLSNYNNYLNEAIYILQYPEGKCSFSTGLIKEINNENLKYDCGTEKGSSGSPILSIANLSVIGVHKRGSNYDYNEGTFIKFAIDKLNKAYTNKKKENNNKKNIIILNNRIIEFNNYKYIKKSELFHDVKDNKKKILSNNIPLFDKNKDFPRLSNIDEPNTKKKDDYLPKKFEHKLSSSESKIKEDTQIKISTNKNNLNIKRELNKVKDFSKEKIKLTRVIN